ETAARKLSLEQSPVLAPGIAGKAVLVDGVPLNHETFDQPYGTGRLSGLLQLRDQIAPQYQMQLDEIARNLVTMFAEGDDGLFVWAGAPGGPENAGTIQVSSSYVTSEGGSPTKLRDGVNGQFNPDGAAGFSDRLRALNEAFSEPMAFDPAAGLAASASL